MSVPVSATTSGASGRSRRHRAIDGALRRAWSATSTSHAAPPWYATSIVTLCPSARRMPPQRSAVTLFPVRDPGRAGVTIQTFIARMLRGTRRIATAAPAGFGYARRGSAP